MRSRVRVFGHAVHPALVAFPLGLLATAVIFDIVYLSTGSDGFTLAAGYMIGAGLIAGLLAALFGLVDWLSITPGTRARRIGAKHGLGNVVVLVLFGFSWLLRAADDWYPGGLALLLSFGGLALAVVTGWLGRELVERLGVSIDPGAGLDAPSSLSRQPTPARSPDERIYPAR